VRYVSDIAVVYGAIGSVIVMLLWLYFSALAILIGAEINAEIDKLRPARTATHDPATGRKRIGAAAEPGRARP
jgi:membrane protein